MSRSASGRPHRPKRRGVVGHLPSSDDPAAAQAPAAAQTQPGAQAPANARSQPDARSQASVHADAATLAGGRNNQDAHAVLDDAAVVLDGASAFPPVRRSRDGGWYARTLRDVLLERLPEHGHTLTAVLADAIAEVRDSHGLRDDGPCATVLIARWDSDRVSLLVLGDSSAVITTTAPGTRPAPPTGRGRHHVLTDRTLADVGVEQRRRCLDQLVVGHGYGPAHTDRLAALQVAQRRHRNRPDGYWIAAADPAAAHHARTLTLARSTVSSILLLTDGATAAVETYRQPPSWDDYLAAADAVGLDELLRTSHDIERTDPDGQRWPRTKRHDDKTAVLLRFTHPA